MKILVEIHDSIIDKETDLIKKYYEYAKDFKKILNEEILNGTSERTARKWMYDILEIHSKANRGAIKKRTNQAEEIYDIINELGGRNITELMQNVTLNELFTLNNEDKEYIKEYLNNLE